jgi:anti-sigma factor RsiW
MADHVTQQTLDYLSDALDPAEKAAFEAHLASCAACAADLEQKRKFLGAVQSALTPPRLSDLELLNRVRAEHEKRQGEVADRDGAAAPRWRLFLGIAAALAAGTAIYISLRQPRLRPELPTRHDSFAPTASPKDAGDASALPDAGDAGQ